MKYKWIVFIGVSLFTAGCYTSHYNGEPEFNHELRRNHTNLLDSSHSKWPSKTQNVQRFVWKMQYIVEQLGNQVGMELIADVSVLMTTITPVDDITKPTGFGRLCTEQLLTELGKSGFEVIEARKTKSYVIKNNVGEFMLSRDVRLLGKEYGSDLVLMGTYSRSGGQVLLNIRLVHTKTASVKATASAMMNLEGDLYLQSILDKDDMAGGGSNVSNVTFAKKIKSEIDPYSEVLQGMTRNLAHALTSPVPMVAGHRLNIAVVTFVDVDHMYRSATFGRFLTERLITELSDLGFDVVEFRMTEDVFTDFRIGELALSREMSRIIPDHHVDAVVVGTYAHSKDNNILVNARLVDGKTQKIISSGAMIVDAKPENTFMASLLKNQVTTVLPEETVEGY